MLRVLQSALLAFAAIIATPGAFALTAADIPFLEGTPVNEDWTISSFDEFEGQIQWAWLEGPVGQALIILPVTNNTPSQFTPWGKETKPSRGLVSLHIQAFDEVTVEITRFGGSIQLNGKEISLEYAPSTSQGYAGQFYDLPTARNLHLSGMNEAIIQTDGAIQSIQGRGNNFDEFYGPQVNTVWQINQNSSVLVSPEGWDISVKIENIVNLIGSDQDDTFYFDEGNTTNTIDGGAGFDSLIATSNTANDSPNCDSTQPHSVTLGLQSCEEDFNQDAYQIAVLSDSSISASEAAVPTSDASEGQTQKKQAGFIDGQLIFAFILLFFTLRILRNNNHA